MTKEQIQQEISEMDAYIPISKIEENLKMPPTTLQKVLTGKRSLPKKWFKVLEAYFVIANTRKNTMKNQKRELMPEIIQSPLYDNLEKEKQHPKYQKDDPREGSNAFYLKYGAFTYDEL